MCVRFLTGENAWDWWNVRKLNKRSENVGGTPLVSAFNLGKVTVGVVARARYKWCVWYLLLLLLFLLESWCDGLLTLQKVQKTQNRIEVRPVYCVCVSVSVRWETRNALSYDQNDDQSIVRMWRSIGLFLLCRWWCYIWLLSNWKILCCEYQQRYRSDPSQSDHIFKNNHLAQRTIFRNFEMMMMMMKCVGRKRMRDDERKERRRSKLCPTEVVRARLF